MKKNWSVHPRSAFFYHCSVSSRAPTVLFSLIPVCKDSPVGEDNQLFSVPEGWSF